MLAAKAASKFGHPGESLDTTVCCQVRSPVSILPYAEKCMLKAFVTQRLWSKWRLARCGYDVEDLSCPLCGFPRDDLHHRLFACSATLSVRDEYLKEDVVDFISREDKKNPLLMLGFQL
eukprot:1482282-Pyramimonas_sp.AAC.1